MANVVLCADQGGDAYLRLAKHECGSGFMQMVHPEHASIPCPGNCQFHTVECCQDMPLTFSPVRIDQSILTGIVPMEVGYGNIADPSLSRIPVCNEIHILLGFAQSATVLLI